MTTLSPEPTTTPLPASSPSLNPLMIMGMMQAICGVDINDFLLEQAATTPEERAKAQVLTLRKMTAHTRGCHLDDVPDFFNFPETGRPPPSA